MLHTKCTLSWVMCVQRSNDVAHQVYTVLGHVCPAIKWCCTASVHCPGSCVSSDQMMLHTKCTLSWVMCVQRSNDAAQQVCTVLGHVCPVIKWCCTASVHCPGSCVSSDQMMLHSKCTLSWVMCVHDQMMLHSKCALSWVMCVQRSNDAAQQVCTVLGHVCPAIKWCCTASVHCPGSCVSSDQMMLHSKCTLFWVMCVQWSQTEAKAVPGFVYKVISCSSLHVLLVLLTGHVYHMS